MDTVRFFIRQKAALVGALLPNPIYINGRYVGTVRVGKSIAADVPKAKAYLVDDGTFFERNAVVHGNDREGYSIVLKRVGAWRTVSHNEFYVERSGKTVRAPSLHFDKLCRAILENRIEELAAEEQVTALCMEFEQRLCTDALFTSENTAQMPEALRQIGANQYADLLRRVIQTDFSDVRFPLSDEQLRHMRDRTEKTCEELSNHRSAYDEFHRAVVHYVLAGLDRTDCSF